MSAPLRVARRDVLAHRWTAQQLGRGPGTARDATDVDLLDLGVQDSGPDGSAWALAVRGSPPPVGDALLLAWTLRGAPHAYRRADVAHVATATAPFSEDDAARRVLDASRPLRAAGTAVLDALVTQAREERAVVVRPTVKGELSTALTPRLPGSHLRWCVPCGATHSYETTFRLAALQAGLELEPGTSPPVLRRVPGFRAPLYRHAGTTADPRFDVVRGYLRFLGPATARTVAGFLDAPVREVRAHLEGRLADAVVPVTVDGVPDAVTAGGPVLALAPDADALAGAAERLDATGWGDDDGPAVRLVGPFDPYLQLQDRPLLVEDAARAKDLWRTLGRPGAVLADGEVVGTWRPRASGRRLTVRVGPWRRWPRAVRAAVEEQAGRLAAFRGATSVVVAEE